MDTITVAGQVQEIRFKNFMNKVDAELLKICGLTHEDLDDYCYRDAFEDGRSPKSVARAARRRAGGE